MQTFRAAHSRRHTRLAIGARPDAEASRPLHTVFKEQDRNARKGLSETAAVTAAGSRSKSGRRPGVKPKIAKERFFFPPTPSPKAAPPKPSRRGAGDSSPDHPGSRAKNEKKRFFSVGRFYPRKRPPGRGKEGLENTVRIGLAITVGTMAGRQPLFLPCRWRLDGGIWFRFVGILTLVAFVLLMTGCHLWRFDVLLRGSYCSVGKIQ